MQFTYDRSLGVVEKYNVIDLYPYKIKDINNFLQRDHIPYKEGDKESKEYAQDVWRKSTEGWWVDDNGTWVFMMPKLFFYANLATIELSQDKSRPDGYPKPRDNEWISCSYILCCDGFSGFADDPDFTCNVRIRDIENGIVVPNALQKGLQRNCVRKDGTWKKYVEAWDYLTWFYHHVNPRPFKLGRALYENSSYNGMWLASRKYGKTAVLSAGDAAHEFWVNGSMAYEELKRKQTVNMFVGASDSEFLDTFMAVLQKSFTNIPGGGKAPHGFFTRTATNNWDRDRGAVEQLFRKEDGTYGGTGSKINKAVIPVNKPQVVVSKRSKRIYADEIGVLGNSKAVIGAADATLKSDEGKFGVFFGSGTGGFIDKIEDTQYIFENPKEFSVYPIPNYWGGGEDIGLFGPASYTLSAYKDENGNTDLIEATKAILADRFAISGGDKSKQTDRRMNEPLEPAEIFLSGKSDYFDKDVIIDRVDILEHGLFKQKGKIYELELGAPSNDPSLPTYEVIATEKTGGWENVITRFGNYGDKTGELIVFEPPMGDGREFLEYNNLYKITYDPISDTPTGSSFISIKVWKGKPQRTLEKDEMFFNIVATAKVKRDDHLMFMLLCLWYKAKGQYERNVSGIPDFFGKYGLKWLLQPTPLEYIKDITPGTRQAQQSGIFMTDQLKREALRVLKKFHKATVHIDGIGRKFKHVETWYDLSLLYEMNHYDDEKNFDDISAMLILMLWLEAEYMPEDSKYAGEDRDADGSWDEMFLTSQRILNQ